MLTILIQGNYDLPLMSARNPRKPQRWPISDVCDVINTSYAMLSRGIPWNMPRVTCIFCMTHNSLGEWVYEENTSDKWHVPR